VIGEHHPGERRGADAGHLDDANSVEHPCHVRSDRSQAAARPDLLLSPKWTSTSLFRLITWHTLARQGCGGGAPQPVRFVEAPGAWGLRWTGIHLRPWPIIWRLRTIITVVPCGLAEYRLCRRSCRPRTSRSRLAARFLIGSTRFYGPAI
jgi:hypothetical protein